MQKLEPFDRRRIEHVILEKQSDFVSTKRITDSDVERFDSTRPAELCLRDKEKVSADVNAKYNEGKSTLSFAKDDNIIQLLKKNGAK